MIVIGVRSSCDTRARKSLFSRSSSITNAKRRALSITPATCAARPSISVMSSSSNAATSGESICSAPITSPRHTSGTAM